MNGDEDRLAAEIARGRIPTALLGALAVSRPSTDPIGGSAHLAAALSPDEIVVGDRARSLNHESVALLKQSISAIGIKTPISVRRLGDGRWKLVAGRHRLQAAIELGLSSVPIRIETGTETDARLWEIAENLHRAELTVTERAEHVAEWIRLTEERAADLKPAQLAPKSKTETNPRGSGRLEGGINAAVRELGIDRTEAQRAVKIAGLSPEAKAAAQEHHFDDNQTALLKAAKEPTPEAQVEALPDHVEERAQKRAAANRAERAQKSTDAPPVPQPSQPEPAAAECEQEGKRGQATALLTRIIDSAPANLRDEFMRLLNEVGSLHLTGDLLKPMNHSDDSAPKPSPHAAGAQAASIATPAKPALAEPEPEPPIANQTANAASSKGWYGINPPCPCNSKDGICNLSGCQRIGFCQRFEATARSEPAGAA
jgi:ParB-like chromosome segregation protein Spo0J